MGFSVLDTSEIISVVRLDLKTTIQKFICDTQGFKKKNLIKNNCSEVNFILDPEISMRIWLFHSLINNLFVEYVTKDGRLVIVLGEKDIDNTPEGLLKSISNTLSNQGFLGLIDVLSDEVNHPRWDEFILQIVKKTWLGSIIKQGQKVVKLIPADIEDKKQTQEEIGYEFPNFIQSIQGIVLLGVVLLILFLFNTLF